MIKQLIILLSLILILGMFSCLRQQIPQESGKQFKKTKAHTDKNANELKEYSKLHKSIEEGMTMAEIKLLLGVAENRQFRLSEETWQYCKSGFTSKEYFTVSFFEGLVERTSNYTINDEECARCKDCFKKLRFPQPRNKNRKQSEGVALDPLDYRNAMELFDKKGFVTIANFNAGSNTSSKKNDTLINHIVKLVNTEPANTFELVGYTNSKGNNEVNLKLSNARAVGLYFLLMETHSLDGSKIIAIGKGEADPIGDNNTKVGRKMNNRVEFRKVQKE